MAASEQQRSVAGSPLPKDDDLGAIGMGDNLPIPSFLRGSDRRTWAKVSAAALTDPRLSDVVFRTLALVGLYANRQGEAFVSIIRLARERGRSRVAIRAHLRAAQELGYLTVERRYRPNGADTSHLYRLAFPSMPDFSPQERIAAAADARGQKSARTRVRLRKGT